MQWTVVVACIYLVHLYFAFVFSSRKHQENVFIWCIYLTRLVLVLMHHHGPLHSVICAIHLDKVHASINSWIVYYASICNNMQRGGAE